MDLTVPHGQSLEAAGVKFQREVASALVRYAGWIHRQEWSADRTAVTVAGPGFHGVISYDETNVYVRGSVPLAFKLLEGSIKSHIERKVGP
jgi:hypothetical protein